MTGIEAIYYIENAKYDCTRPGLSRIRELMDRLGNPQNNLKFIHVTGTNGKGSTCRMLSSICTAAGYKTGLFTSPQIQCFEEKLQIDGAYISREEIGACFAPIKEACLAMEDHPSQFEMLTALALVYFAKEACDLVVLEVGMGGLLDATNVIPAPLLAVFTNIGIDHTEYLGATLEEITKNKGGIIKPGCQVVSYDYTFEANQIIEETLSTLCLRQKVPYTKADFSRLSPLSHSLDGQEFQWGGATYLLPLLGKHQLNNAAVILTVLEVLEKLGYHFTKETIQKGLSTVTWPARFEVLRKDEEMLFLLDGGHNLQCAQAIEKNLRDYLPGKKITLFLGVLADKDYKAELAVLLPYVTRVICVSPENKRALAASDLADYIVSQGVPAKAFDTIAEGLAYATVTTPKREAILAFGSLYMAGHIRSLLCPSLAQGESRITSYLDALASSESVPGGGSVLGLCAALSAALASMALSISQQSYSKTPSDKEVSNSTNKEEALLTLCRAFTYTMTEDSLNFAPLAEVYHLPDTLPEKKEMVKVYGQKSALQTQQMVKLAEKLEKALEKNKSQIAPALASDFILAEDLCKLLRQDLALFLD